MAWIYQHGRAVVVLAAVRLLAGAAALRLSQEPDAGQGPDAGQLPPLPPALGPAGSLLPAPEDRAPPRPLAWLHIPKCGTSFANIIYGDKRICPYMVDSMKAGDQWSDFVRHHNLDLYCPGSFAKPFTGDHYGLGLDYGRIPGSSIVAFFRQPEQRMIAGYLDKQKDYPNRWEGWVPIATYADKLSGCAARMLSRGFMPCGDLFSPTNEDVVKAVGRVKHLGFVGLTDEWDLSVCLWYTMFGGNCTDVAFHNTRPGKARRDGQGHFNSSIGPYNVSEWLGKMRDPYDGSVYDAAKKVFWERVAQYDVKRSTCARTCAAAVETQPFLVSRDGVATALEEEGADEGLEYDWPGRRYYVED